MQEPDTDPLWSAVADATFQAYREAVIRLPPDVLRVIRKAAACRDKPGTPRRVCNILKNIEWQSTGSTALQDTGVPVVYLAIPPDVP